jgi:hypothetical protein
MDISLTTSTHKYQKYGLGTLLLFSFCWIVSLPILAAGYFSDDAINSLIPGSFELFHQNFFSGIWGYMRDWLANGRFFPLSVISSVTVFYLFSDILSYQILAHQTINKKYQRQLAFYFMRSDMLVSEKFSRSTDKLRYFSSLINFVYCPLINFLSEISRDSKISMVGFIVVFIRAGFINL